MPKRKKINLETEEKVQIVFELTEKNSSIDELAKAYSVSPKVAKSWKNKFLKRVFLENLLDEFTTKINNFYLKDEIEDTKKRCKQLLLFVEKFFYEKDILTVATTYTQISMIYAELKEYDKALDYFFKSLKIKEDFLDKGSMDIAESYENIAFIYEALRKYNEALKYSLKALKIKEKLLGKNKFANVENYISLGSLYQILGKDKIALRYFLKIYNIEKEVSTENKIEIAQNYKRIGFMHDALQEFSYALEYLFKALRIEKGILGEKHVNITETYYYIGLTYYNLEDYDKALEYFFKILKIEKEFSEENNINIVEIYEYIGLIYNSLEKYNKALEFYLKALGLKNKFLKKGHIDIADSYESVGFTYVNLYEYDKALDCFFKALRIKECVLEERNIDIVNIYENIGLIYHNLEEYDKALEYLFKVLNINQKILKRNIYEIMTNYLAIAFVYRDFKNYEEAYYFAKEAYCSFLNFKHKSFQDLDSFGKQNFMKNHTNHFYSILEIATFYIEELEKKSELQNREQIKNEVFDFWLKHKGSIAEEENLLIELYESSESIKLKDKIDRLMRLKRDLGKLYQSELSSKESENREDIKNEILVIEIYLSKHIFKFKEQMGLKDINFKDISKELSEDSIYIDFAKTQNQYFIFILNSENHIDFLSIGAKDSEEIDRNISSFREKIYAIDENQLEEFRNMVAETNSFDESSGKSEALQLYKIIIEKNLSKFIEGKNRLIISPDGLLNLLPFEALCCEDEVFLIEEKNISYIPSGREFVRLSRKLSTKSQKIVMFYDPDYNLDISNNIKSESKKRSVSVVASLKDVVFNPLGFSKAEADSISDLFIDNIDIFREKKATEGNLYNLDSPKYLHLITHGFFVTNENIDNPMLKSGIALTGANSSIKRGKDDGVVTSLKLMGLNLNNTELVTISACESGVGDISEAEGVAGLNKAFIMAGARNIIISLWEVPDEETKDIFSEFYSRVKRGEEYYSALRSAKEELINYHPIFWAGFILNGFEKKDLGESYVKYFNNEFRSF